MQYFLNPLNGLNSVKGVKLEDIKNNPKISLSKITKWINIKNDKSIYESEFMGKNSQDHQLILIISQGLIKDQLILP